MLEFREPHTRIVLRRISRLVAASSINTLTGLAIIGLLYKLTSSPFVTLTLSAVFGYVYSIYSYNAIGFDRGLAKPPYRRYMVVYGAALIANATLTKIGLGLTNNFFLVQVFVLPTVVVLQWLASCFWAFRR